MKKLKIIKDKDRLAESLKQNLLRRKQKLHEKVEEFDVIQSDNKSQQLNETDKL